MTAFVSHNKHYANTEQLLPYYKDYLKKQKCSGVVLAYGSCVLVQPDEEGSATFDAWNKEKRWQEMNSCYPNESVFELIEKENEEEVQRIWGKASPYDARTKACISRAFAYLNRVGYPPPGSRKGDRAVSEMDGENCVFIAKWTAYPKLIGLCKMSAADIDEEWGLLPYANAKLGDLLRYDIMFPRVATVLYTEEQPASSSPSSKKRVAPEWKSKDYTKRIKQLYENDSAENIRKQAQL